MKAVLNFSVLTYFLIASLSVMVAQNDPPANAWGWFRWAGAGVLAGLIAIKAKISPIPPDKS
jgi:hypothetical protein